MRKEHWQTNSGRGARAYAVILEWPGRFTQHQPRRPSRSSWSAVERNGEFRGDVRHECIWYTAPVPIPLDGHPRMASVCLADNGWICADGPVTVGIDLPLR